MYYILYPLLYCFSLLPWRILYIKADFFYLLVYHVIGYRKKVVMSNLLIAFPDKTEKEREMIAREFYKNLIDTFIETIKFLSLSDAGFSRRMSGNFEVLNELYASGQDIQLHSGHFFNWEYMNWAIPRFAKYPFIGVYFPVKNKAVDKIILNMRQRYGSIMLSVQDFKTKFHQLAKSRHALGLYADQNPSNALQSYWLPFFGKLTPFVAGPEKSARINNVAVVFVHHYRIKRGYYQADFTVVTTQPRDTERGELTRTYVNWLQDCIRKKPSNYLWSHRRWKHNFKEEYKKNLFS